MEKIKYAKFLRRFDTEEKAKVVAAVWGPEFIQSLATLHRFSARMI